MSKIAIHSVIWGLILLGIGAGDSEARTWRVERDGSGDFANIPDALSATSEGDTVFIGPGRFTESVPFIFAPPNLTTDVLVPISVDSLTIIGSGIGVTIIGPEAQEIVGEGPKGIVVPLGLTRFAAKAMTIENLKHGAFMSGRADLDSVELSDCLIGAWQFTTGASVNSCRFYGNDTGISTGDGCGDFTIARCSFIENHLGVGVNRTRSVAVQESGFVNGEWSTGGIQYSENSTGSVSDCVFDGSQEGIAVRSSSEVTLTRNRFSGHEVALHVFDGSIARGTKNVFRGSGAALFFSTTSTAYLNDNHIVKSDGWAVLCSGFNLHHVDIDLRNNYWGTDSPDSIDAWIYDENDEPDPPFNPGMVTVLYEPFSPVRVETAEESVGTLKSLFRRR